MPMKKLKKLKSTEIDISETTLGRAKEQQMKMAAQCLCQLKKDEINALLGEYENKHI